MIMKNVFFYLQNSIGSWLRYSLQGLLLLMLLSAQSALVGRNILETSMTFEDAPTDVYYASIGLNPAAESGATLTVFEEMSDLPGFSGAHLSASLGYEGSLLTVTLTGVSIKLPSSAFLGTVVVADNTGNRTFEVWVEGGGIVVEADF
jgi:hypothetical protein